MRQSYRNRLVMGLAVAGGVSSLLGNLNSVYGQQSLTDVLVTQVHDDANSAIQSGLNVASLSGTTWFSPAVNPTSGYAYADESYRIRTPSTSSYLTFLGDSLTLLSINPSAALNSPSSGIGAINPANGDGIYAYLTLKGTDSNTVPTATTFFNNLVLANAGNVTNFANDSQTIAGNIYLAPAGTAYNSSNGSMNPATANATTVVSGGIIDTHGNNESGYLSDPNFNYTISSNIAGSGMLRVENTGGGQYPGSTFVRQVVILSGTSTFSGGLVLDGTSTTGTVGGVTGNGPDLCINSPTALGTGTLTILPASYVGESLTAGAPGLAIDNLTGASETLTTNNAQSWLGNFTFYGTNSLDMGNGAITLGANVTLTTTANTLSLEGAISGPYGLTKTGAGTLLLNGVGSYTGATNISAGTLGGKGTIPAALNILSPSSLLPGLSATSPGLLTIDGALTLSSGSTLDIELTSGTSDELLTLGQVNLTGSTLYITLANGYTPAIGTTFTIIDNDSTFGTTGPFSNDIGGFVTDALGDTYSISYAADVDSDAQSNDVTLTFVSPVPEPASLSLLGFSAMGLLARRHRKQA